MVLLSLVTFCSAPRRSFNNEGPLLIFAVALSGAVGVSNDAGVAAAVLVDTPLTVEVRGRLVVSVLRWDPAPVITTGGLGTLAVVSYTSAQYTIIVRSCLFTP